MKKVVLYLMNEKGRRALEKLCDYFEHGVIKAVVASKDPAVKNDYYDEIEALCDKYDIHFVDRHEDSGLYDKDYRLAIGWRWIISSEEKLIIFHDSLLPKYRGFSPLVNSLINGEKELGVSVLFAGSAYDSGEIIAQKSLSVSYPITISEAITEIVPLYQDLAVEVVQTLQSSELNGIVQNNIDATYSIWRDEEDYCIDWEKSAEDIVRFINAVGYPYLGACCRLGGRVVKVLEAVTYEDVHLELRHVGKVMFVDDDFPVVITGKGLVKLMRLEDVDGNNLLPLKQFRERFK